MEIKHYSQDLKKQWNDFLQKSKNNLFMFDRDYMEYHSDRFQDYSLIIYNDKNQIIALLPANIKDNILYSHQGLTFGGFITDQQMKTSVMLEIFKELKISLKKDNIQKLIYKAIPYIYSTMPAQEDLYALSQNQAKLIRTDISTTINLQEDFNFSKLRKRGIKKAQKANINITKSNNYQTYINMLNKVLQAQHQAEAVHTTAEIDNLQKNFPENIKLYIAIKDNEILAGTILFVYKNIVHCQYIAASDEGKSYGALDLLFSTLITETYSDKKYFDFGISTENNGHYLNEGLIAQKEGFGGRGIIHQFFELNI